MIEPQADFMSVRASRAAQSFNRQGATPAANENGAEANSAREKKVVELHSRKPLDDRPENDHPEEERQEPIRPDEPEILVQPPEKKPRRRAAAKPKPADAAINEPSTVEKSAPPSGAAAKKRSRSTKAAQPSTAAQAAVPEVPPIGGTEQLDQIQSRVKFLQQITTELASEMDRLKEIAVEIDQGSQAIGNSDSRAAMSGSAGFSAPYAAQGYPPAAASAPTMRSQPTDEYYVGATGTARGDRLRTEQDALRMAQTLRDRTHREGSGLESHWAAQMQTGGTTFQPPTRQRTLKSYLRQWRQTLQLPRHPVGRVIDAIGWVLGATLLRVGLKFLVATFSLPQLPITLLMVAIAVYLAIIVPRSTQVSVYRFLLIVLGFWLGGR
jgi:hypothetical protein